MKIIALPFRCSLVLSLGAAYLALLLPAAFAQSPAQPAPPAKTFSMGVSNGNLQTVLLTLERQYHIKAQVQDDSYTFKPVTVHLEDATLAQILRSIAQSAGAKVTKNLDGVYVFESEDGSIRPTPWAGGGIPHPPKPDTPSIPAPTHLYKISLVHIHTSEVLNTMRWRDASRADGMANNSRMPEGVVRVYADPKDDYALLMQSTPDGFVEMRKIVKILDDSGHGFSPHISFISASPDKSGLHYHYQDGPINDLQVFAGDDITTAFRRLTKSGRSPKLLKTLHEFDFTQPLRWAVSGVSISLPRLYDDDTLALHFSLSDSQRGPQSLVWDAHIVQGDILAIVQKDQPLITFLKVDW